MSDIAIVGIGCRFAGGIDSPESFWDFVLNKRDGVTEIPADRWDWRRYYDADRRAPGRMYTKRAAFLTEDPWGFDPDFFGISPREATAMDPQQRLILKVTWEALDDAGIAQHTESEQVGVYVGAFMLDQIPVTQADASLPYIDMHTAAGASHTMLSNRIAYALNLLGPAITVDTACSSSLVALHLACQALENGDCTVALAGGVSLMLQPTPFVNMCKGGFLATDGRSKSFDAAADGYGRGEGAGMIVLKPLADAERDEDRIYAVIKATGSNQDGRTTAITVPNADSQQALAEKVTRRAGIAPHEVDYVEAHGTGTPVGDPLELQALSRAYVVAADRNAPLAVGSAKATLGHTEAASGIASVIKSALAVSHRTLPPQGWTDRPNPEIPFEDWGIQLQLEAEPVGPEADRFTIAVNGFGYGGTNAHAILTEPPHPKKSERVPKHYGVLPLSARSEQAVRELAGRMVQLIADGASPESLAEAAWTRRRHHNFRVGLPFGDETELVQALADFAAGEGRGASRLIPQRTSEPVFVFTGMGPQWWAMGRELLTAGGAFAAEAARIDAVFQEIAGWSIVAELLRPEQESRVTATEVAQPANFLIQVALVTELAELNITPAAVVGHSVGEVAAAYVTGMLTLREALLVSYHRARLQATTAGSGGMLAVGLAETAARELIGDDSRVDIAAVNSPTAVTLAGDITRLEEIAAQLTEQGAFAKRLQVEVPYHSHLMDPILDELRRELAELSPKAPQLPLYSTVTGAQVAETGWDAEYWCANVRRPVRFADATTALVGAGSRVFLEVGPHPVLGANIREVLLSTGETGTSIATLHRKQTDSDSLRRAVAAFYTAGVLDIEALFGQQPSPYVPLPRYPWQNTRLRMELPAVEQRRHGTPGAYPMLGDPSLDEPTTLWTVQLSAETLPWLPDHVVDGNRLLPGVAYLDAALSAAAVRSESTAVSVADVRFVAPLVVAEGDVPVVELRVEEVSGRFTIRSRTAAGSGWTVNSTGRLVAGVFEPTKVDIPDTGTMLELDTDILYAELTARGVEYGPTFRRVTALRAAETTVVAEIDAEIAQESRHLVHPCVADAALHCMAALLSAGSSRHDGATVPVGVDSVRVFSPLSPTVTVLARLRPGTELSADVDLLDSEQNLCVQLVGMRFGSIAPGRGPLPRLAEIFYEERWEARDPIAAGMFDTDESATLVVAMGRRADHRSEQIAAGMPRSQLLVSGEPASDTATDALGARLRALVADGTASRLHVCLVAGTDYPDLDALWTLRRIALAVDEFAQSWAGARDVDPSPAGDGSVHVTVVTEHAFTHPQQHAAPNLVHAGLAGARRVLLNEFGHLRWRLIDVEPDTDIDLLTLELSVPGAFSHDNSDEVFLRGSTRWVSVVARSLEEHLEARDRTQVLEDPEANAALEIPRSRMLSQLAWRQVPRREPEAGEVEVRMRAVGLNFKDPLKVLGVLTEHDLAGTFFGTTPGMDGAGTVVRVGPGVTEFAVGDIVGVTARGMLARYVTAPAEMVSRSAPDSDPKEASSITPFITAEYSLLELARVQPGETVLIHGAAGGVGSAAIQVALLHGARVIGTASTAERRAYVLAQGAEYALNSRSLNFVEDVLALTGGRGVDIVLSSAPGEILRRNFEVVTEFGRIVEIGKADTYSDGLLEQRSFDKNLSYFSVDMDRLLARRPAVVVGLAAGCNRKVHEGTYQALPYRAFGMNEVAKAFEEAARSNLIGRVVIDLEDPAPLVRPEIPEIPVHADGQYLITGGFGGFGLAIGRWLVARGARHLTLLGRSGATTDAARTQLAAWQRAGITVTSELADMTDADAVQTVVLRAHRPERPLRGIFHTAGAVEDNLLGQLEWESLARVYLPKVDGVRALDRALATAGIEPELFVLFSSGGTLFGNIGQYSYVSANMALQASAELIARRQSGSGRVLAVGWGHMSGGSGMAAEESVRRYLDAYGYDPLDMDEGAEHMEEVLRLGITQAAIFPIAWHRTAAVGAHFGRTGRLQAQIAAALQKDSAAEQWKSELAALDEGKRGEVVAFMLAEQLATVMGVTAESIDLTVPLPELGLDSLMAVEFDALTTKTLGIALPTLQLGRSFSLEQAGAKVAEYVTSGSAV